MHPKEHQPPYPAALAHLSAPHTRETMQLWLLILTLRSFSDIKRWREGATPQTKASINHLRKVKSIPNPTTRCFKDKHNTHQRKRRVEGSKITVVAPERQCSWFLANTGRICHYDNSLLRHKLRTHQARHCTIRSSPESSAFLRPSGLREASGPLREQRTDPTPTAAREALATSCCGEQRQGEAAAPTTSLPIGADTPPLPHRGKSALVIGSSRGHRAFLVGELGVSSAGEEAATR
ncbi:hypothetical protein E2C01_052485 [Portunus trituberculatus]|uniref:Uncharacterized protein n=1 Tax=Portunus trituberculatus TaxID=210409 RepID=A0A5B7GDV4_PORTR|nr:hypothetical protein [Portunus trituberculatus]